MLRFELEQMRAMEDEARKTNQLLIEYIDYILQKTSTSGNEKRNASAP